MARKPRFALPGYPQHIVQRGNNRQGCFFEESDYRKYLDSLAEAAHKYECQVHAYVLMTNHVHLLVTPTTGEGIPHASHGVEPWGRASNIGLSDIWVNVSSE